MPSTAEKQGVPGEALQSLQILRGLAAWLVVYHHYMQVFHDLNSATALGRFFADNGAFGVDIFFVISGFIMFWSLEHRHYTAREFLVRRVLRIVPAYWFMTLAFIPILLFFPPPANIPLGWTASSLVHSLLFIPHPNPAGIGWFPLLTVGWTLNYEMFFYVGLAVALFCCRRHWFWACTGALITLPLLFGNSSGAYSLILKSNLLYEFVLGMGIAKIYLRSKAWANMWGPILGCGWVFVGAVLYWTNGLAHPPFDFTHVPLVGGVGNLTRHVSASAFVCAALSFESCLAGLSVARPLKYLGDISYSTYLVHLISALTLFHLFGPWSSDFKELPMLVAYTGLTLGLSHFSYQWLETGPVMDIFRRALLRPRARSTATKS